MAHKPVVTVTAFRQWQSNVMPDYAILPDGCPDEGGIVLFAPMESVSKYDRITVDCRTFTDRVNMYEGLAPYIPLPDDFDGRTYEINKNAFRSRTDILSITLSQGVTAIGDRAFYGCKSFPKCRYTQNK